MKNLHYLKKFVVMVLAAMMTLSTFAMPTFAADDTTAKIFGLPKTGVTVKAYKIVKQDNNGGWVSINSDGTWGGENKTPALTDPTKPTSAQITTLATKDLTKAKVAFNANSAWTEGNTDAQKATQFWSADLKDDAGKKYGTDNDDGAGMYLVLVESTGNGLLKVYNPMIVSIYPDGTTGELKAGSVDANGNFNAGGTPNIAYAKSSEPTFDKYITRDKTESGANDKPNHNQGNQELTDTTNVLNNNTSGETEKGDTASRGDTVWFEINTTMPVYADNYTNPTFQIHDQLSSGLTLNQDSLEVWVDSKKVEKGDNTWSVAFGEKDDGDKFDITFASTYLKAKEGALAQKKVVVKYSAVVDNDCDENFDPETNEAYITYTHKPGENGTKDSEKKKTYHYTFSINGRINGEGSTFLREVVKVGVTDENVWVYEETKKKDAGWVEDIEGATFNLYKAADMTMNGDKAERPAAGATAYRTAYSAADGRLVGGKYDANGDGTDETYTGLDRLDAGVYYLVEQSVPSPYKVKETPIKVVITSNLNADGTLDWYKIEVGDKPVVAGEYKAIYDKNADGSYKLDTEGEPLIKEYQIKKDGEWKTSKTAAQAKDTTATGSAPAKPDKAAYDAADDGRIEGKTYEEALNAWFEACKDYFAANDPLGEAADIPNTKTGTLPSTGGMGTVLFTIGGALIMALALFILFGGKKKQHQK